MRRALALIATLALSCCLFAGTAWAAGTSAKITMGGADVKPGQEVTLPINLGDNPGIAGVGLEVALPEGATLKSIEKGALLSSGTFSVNKNIITWYADNDVKTNGVLANVTFTAPTAPGSYKVAVGFLDGRAANISNQNFEVVPATCEAGTLKVADPESLKVDLSTCSVTLAQTSYTYTGAEIKPAVTVKSGNKALTANTDYTVAYKDNKAIGTATVTVTGKGNYKGTKSVTFTIAEPPKTNVSKCTIELSPTEFVADGTAKTPAVTVTYEGKPLAANTDYTVKYENNTDAGIATVTVTGKGDYTGSKNATFKITEPAPEPVTRDISTECSVSLPKYSYTYDGAAKTPGVVVEYDGAMLKKDVDYTVSYANNTEVGTGTVTVTGMGLYYGSTTLDFYIEEPVEVSVDDDVFEIENGKLIRYYGEETTVVVPDGVTSIGGNAFTFEEGANASIILPDSVTALDEDAFIFNPGITRVELSSNLESIGPWAFYGCTGLTEIVLPSSLTTIDEKAFGATGLTSIAIPSGVTTIAESAFTGCENLSKVTLPSGVESIGDSAFSGCTALTSVNIPATVATVGMSAFEGCSSLAQITLHEGLTELGGYAFGDCASLSSITLPASLSSMDSTTFSGCTNLQTVALAEGTKAVADNLFAGCESLTSITLPAGLTSIGYSSFEGCTSLRELVLPEGLTEIGDWAFNGCESLASVSIPKSLNSVGNYVFNGCTNLTSVSFANGIKAIPANLFTNCESITDVTIPNGVTSIGADAFSFCYGLKSLTIPASVTTLGEWAFFGCSNLEEITFLGNAPTTRGESVFGDAEAKLVTPKGNSTWTQAIVEELGYGLKWIYAENSDSAIDLAACDVYLDSYSYSYTGAAVTPKLVVEYGADSLVEGTDYSVTCANNTNVGEATVTVKGMGDYTGESTFTFQIEPCDINETAITVSDLAYNGKSQSPTVTVKFGNKQLSKGADYALSGETAATRVGTHTLLVTGKGNFTGSAVATYEMTGTEPEAAKIDIATLKPYLKAKTFYYNYGNEITPQVVVPGLKEDKDFYTYTYSSMDAGTGHVVIIGAGEYAFRDDCPYNGEVDLAFTIKPLPITKVTPKLAKTSATYNNGKAVKVGVKFNRDLEAYSYGYGDYTVSYSNFKNIGTATVTVKGYNNYTGTKKLTYKIVPPKAAIKKVKAAKKSMTVTAKAQKGGVKYQYSYRLGKGKWVNKTSKKASLKITKLKSKKKYQVRVRTFKKVGKTTYYGAWSTAKTVKVK